MELSSQEVKRLLLDLDAYGGTDPVGLFPLFFRRGQLRFCPSSRCGISAAPSFG